MTQPGVSFSDHDAAASALGERVRAKARELGFDTVAVARADVSLERDVERYEAFVAAGMHGEMSWLARHRDARARLDGDSILPGARSVVCLARRYQRPPQRERDDPETARTIARYARGRDYHGFLRQRVRRLAAFIRTLGSPGRPVSARPLCDDAPVLERAWASRAGLGFVGKNGLLIVPGVGSMVLLGEVVTTLRLDLDEPMTERCGACTRCLEACPTRAFVAPFVLDPAAVRLVPDDRAPRRDCPGPSRRRRVAPVRLRRVPDGLSVQRGGHRARPASHRRWGPLRAPGALVARTSRAAPGPRRGVLGRRPARYAPQASGPREPGAQRGDRPGQPGRPGRAARATRRGGRSRRRDRPRGGRLGGGAPARVTRLRERRRATPHDRPREPLRGLLTQRGPCRCR